MWRHDNQTPFAAGHTWIRDTQGAEIWIVAVKASYELLPDGRMRVARHQPAINTGTVLHEDGVSPLFETDLGPPKPATDVWLAGHAYSQSGEPITRMTIGFEVGPVSRAVHVWGDRYWVGLLHETPSESVPFTKMPLTWARAYGGGGPDCETGNPVGCGIRKGAKGVKWLPNLEHPSKPLTNRIVGHPSMGVGPVLRHWPARRPFAGTYNDAWAKTRAPLAPLDVQPQYWQVAPKAQQAKGHLKGGEKVMLQGVTPPGFAEFGVIQATLPRLSLGFRTKFYDGSVANTRSVIHSVILQPDGYQGSGPIISVVHHMHLPCHALVNKLDTTTIIEKRRPLDKTQALSGQNEKQDLEPDWEKSWV